MWTNQNSPLSPQLSHAAQRHLAASPPAWAAALLYASVRIKPWLARSLFHCTAPPSLALDPGPCPFLVLLACLPTAMRLFLLPISTRRSLLYCQKLHEKAPADRSLLDKITLKADSTWSAWEKDTTSIWNWKAKTTHYGNQLLRRIPYEEWGLKTLPPLTAARKRAIVNGNGTERLDVVFPGKYLDEGRVRGLLDKLARERQGIHRSKLIWSIIIMPFTAPFMLVPVVPNLPFFYVLYRAFSHWKGMSMPLRRSFCFGHQD